LEIFQEVNSLKNKKGKPNIAPLNCLPLLPSDPGGVQQELVVPACRGAKIVYCGKFQSPTTKFQGKFQYSFEH
jgi:hypothetical protein